MKTLKSIFTYTFCTFSVLSILVGILCKTDILDNLSYVETVFPLLLMSFATTVFVTLREILIPNSVIFKYLIDLLGCSMIILLIGHFVGWLEVSASYFLLVCSMVLAVYLLVWFITWMQSKHDEGYLNHLLSKQLEKQNKQNK